MLSVPRTISTIVIGFAIAGLAACVDQPELAENIGTKDLPLVGPVCDAVVTSNSDDDVIYGTVFVQYAPNSVWERQNQGGATSLSYGLAVCTRSNGGPWVYRGTQCTTDTPSNQYLYILTQGGNDRVAPAQRRVSCQGLASNERLGPPFFAAIPGSYRFGLAVYGGSGSDEIYGTPNNDHVFTHNFSGTADNSYDLACGFGGNDTLFGDEDDSYGAYECLHGSRIGSDGIDHCDGVGDRSDGREYDRHYHCDSTESSRQAAWYWTWCADRNSYCPKWERCRSECASIPDLTR